MRLARRNWPRKQERHRIYKMTLEAHRNSGIKKSILACLKWGHQSKNILRPKEDLILAWV